MHFSSFWNKTKGRHWFPLPGRSTLFTVLRGSLSIHQSAFLDKLSSNKKIWQSISTNLGPRSISSKVIGPQQLQFYHQRTIGYSFKKGPVSEPNEGPFDICRAANVGLVKLNNPLYDGEMDVESPKNDFEPQYLRYGVVLLKNFISHINQVKIVNKCRDLGIGCGGFYRPRHKNRAKLHFQMMCLGKDWDPQSNLYKDSRSFDDVVPPEIPEEFKKVVDDSLHASHYFLRQIAKSVNEIPKMSPDICIVNFCNSDDNANLDLHKVKVESQWSPKEGLPVVSFSVGDSAAFLYTVAKWDSVERLIIESGDVLIFGGESRHIFHGPSSIIPNTAPKLLINETNLRPGRLNLTFRKC